MAERNNHLHKKHTKGEGTLEDHRQQEELLEILWSLREQDKLTVPDTLGQLGGDGAELLRVCIEKRWIRRDGENLSFEPHGEERAREIIRRHRLAERLLYDVLDMGWDQFEENACRFEHVLSPEVTESICTFLGHPKTCPHGRAIPSGECCQRLKREVTPLVRPLSDLRVGQEGAITFMTTQYRSRMSQLSSLGVIPGTTVKLRQRYPTYVIEVGESHIAVDKDIARNIYVRASTGSASVQALISRRS